MNSQLSGGTSQHHTTDELVHLVWQFSLADHTKGVERRIRPERHHVHTSVFARLASASDNVVHVVTGRCLHHLKEPCVNSKSPSKRAIASSLVGDARSTYSRVIGVMSLSFFLTWI